MKRCERAKKALVVGGNSGVGLAVTLQLLSDGYSHVYIVGKDEVKPCDIPAECREHFALCTTSKCVNLVNEDYSFLDSVEDIDALIITAGFGRVAPFDALSGTEITNLIKCNTLAAIRIIKHYYSRICSGDDFYCAVMGSIAGRIVSPLFSVYGATKSALASFIESVNIELIAAGVNNRILEVSPGAIKGTAFSGKANDLALLSDLAQIIVEKMYNREVLYIPQYEEVYKGVIARYKESATDFGLQSYNYKIENGRLQEKSPIKIGFLSGTFDLFHIGHLNLLKRAKSECDYLIVSVHESGAWKGKTTFIPYEERKSIIESIKYVDLVVKDYKEDIDAWEDYHYDKLFVGSDYYGTERFKRYEEYLSEKNVEIVYFPYTQGTSSTQLRDKLSSKSDT